VFGMGTGVAPPLQSPGKLAHLHNCIANGERHIFVPVIVSARPISTGKLNVLPRLHTQPINLVVYQGPYISRIEET
jgi:hypothetical protein